MSKVNLPSIPGGYLSLGAMNSRFAAIEDAFENTLSRDGSLPNSMEASLDMDSNRILNLPHPTTASEPVRRDMLDSVLTWNGEPLDSVYATVAALKADSNLVVGQYVRTLGYTTPGDGGDNLYEIVAAATGTDDGGSFIDLAGSGLQAKGLFGGNIVSVTQFGAAGDGVTDDYAPSQAAADWAGGLGYTVLFPSGSYLFGSDVILRSPVAGMNEEVTIHGRFNLHEGAGTLVDLKFNQVAGALTKLENRAVYLSEGIDRLYVLRCTFDGCALYTTEVDALFKAETVWIRDSVFTGLVSNDDVNAVELRNPVSTTITGNLFGGSFYRALKISTLAEPGSDNVVISGNTFTFTPTNGKQVIDLFINGGRRVDCSGNIFAVGARAESAFDFKDSGTPGEVGPLHEEISFSNNVVKGEYDRVVHLTGAYGRVEEGGLQKVDISGNVIEVTNADADEPIRVAFMHYATIANNTVVIPSPSAACVRVVSPNSVSITGNNMVGRVFIEGQSRVEATPCSAISLSGNNIALDTSITYGVIIQNLDPDAGGSCFAVTGNNVKYIGGTRESYRINNLPFDSGVIVGNTTSNNTEGLSAISSLPTSFVVESNSFAYP